MRKTSEKFQEKGIHSILCPTCTPCYRQGHENKRSLANCHDQEESKET